MVRQRLERGFIRVKQGIAIPLILIALIAAVYLNNRQGVAAQAHEGRIAHEALCAFKENLETTQASSRKFLKEHPDGIPGISARDIKLSISNRQKTINSLYILEC